MINIKTCLQNLEYKTLEEKVVVIAIVIRSK